MVVTLTPWHHGPAASLRTWLKAYVELTCPWPERGDMDVPMAVCTTVVMGELTPMPSDEQIALWREYLTSSMTVAVSACLEVMVLERFVAVAGDYDVVWRSQLDSCTEPDRLRARIGFACDGHAADGRKCHKTVRMCAERM